ncbi:MAG TPA: hypothetical protein VNY05_01085 [Candidatus Acidoferrales bacterium]|nr:hypothetical protein [Candidatus Acidoferrales bacterium]
MTPPRTIAHYRIAFSALDARWRKHIVFGQFVASGSDEYGIWWIRYDGSGQPEKLLGSKERLDPSSLSPDGRLLAFGLHDPGTGDHIWTLPSDLSDPDHPKLGKPEPFPREPDNQWDAAFSTDGRWLAYTSFQSAGAQVFVQPFPASPSGGKWLISAGSGRFPIWSPNGRELFYLSDSDNRIMVAGYTAKGDSFVPEKPRQWSPTPIARMGVFRPLSLAPDGKRIVVFSVVSETPGDDKASVHVTVLLNFFDELRRRMPK